MKNVKKKQEMMQISCILQSRGSKMVPLWSFEGVIVAKLIVKRDTSR